MSAPNQSTQFDTAYRLPITIWGDVRIPKEIETLAREGAPKRSLELGCGLGRLTRYMTRQGLQATGVDFSPVAIARATERVARDARRPEFLVGDVTHLDVLSGPFDVAYDVGCFHCLDERGQRAYAAELFRLLKPGATLLIWAMDSMPAGRPLGPEAVRAVCAPHFELTRAQSSRRRIVASHWYWLTRTST
jgi:SAM-dependent methyltransferase